MTNLDLAEIHEDVLYLAKIRWQGVTDSTKILHTKASRIWFCDFFDSDIIDTNEWQDASGLPFMGYSPKLDVLVIKVDEIV